MAYFLSAAYADVFESFLAWEQNRVTAQGYTAIRKNTLNVLKWFEGEELPLEEATVRDALRYRNDLGGYTKKDGTALSTGTVHNRLKAGKTLFHYLVAEGIRRTNPFAEVKRPRLPEHYSRNVLSEVQMGCLLERLTRFDQAVSCRERLGRYRLHVVAEFLYATGLRIAEAAGLVPENIDTSSRLVYVPEGKGKKARLAFLTGFAAEVIKLYLERGRKAVLGSYERGYGRTVFGAHPERLMSVVNRDLKTVCRELELPVISSHGFRHSLGTHLLRAGCDMRYIQIILGHDALATTQVYTRVDKDDLKDSLDRFHPRKWSRT
jgi:site-specific recombinase XerD